MERGFVDAIIEKNGGSSYQKLDESKRTEQQQSSESWMKTLAISIFFSAVLISAGLLFGSRYHIEKIQIFKTADGLQSLIRYDNLTGAVEVCSASLDDTLAGSTADKIKQGQFILFCHGEKIN